MRYAVELRPAAARALRVLPRQMLRRVSARIDSLALAPRPPGSRLLAGPGRFHRVRVGDYRVVYQVDDSQHRLLVITIGHRRDGYR